jgi:hypothetical protein
MCNIGTWRRRERVNFNAYASAAEAHGLLTAFGISRTCTGLGAQEDAVLRYGVVLRQVGHCGVEPTDGAIPQSICEAERHARPG